MLLTVAQVAKRLGVSEALVYDWCASGLLPHYKMGRKGRRGTIRISPQELEAFLAGMKVEGRKEAPPPTSRSKPVDLKNLRLNLS